MVRPKSRGTAEPARPGGAPLVLRVARALERRGLRGGTRLTSVAIRAGWLDRVARYELGNGTAIDVPLRLRPVDAIDIRRYESALVSLLVGAIARMSGPVTFFDCGADIGLIALLVASRAPGLGRVVALEPNAAVFPHLEANLARLPIEARALQAAAGDTPGYGTLRSPAHDETDVARYVERNADGDIRMLRVDDLSTKDDSDIVLKCDVEGTELDVVRGALETIRRARRFAVAFEAHPRHVDRTGIDPTAVIRLIRSLRPCTVRVAEMSDTSIVDSVRLFDQLRERRVVNLVCESE